MELFSDSGPVPWYHFYRVQSQLSYIWDLCHLLNISRFLFLCPLSVSLSLDWTKREAQLINSIVIWLIKVNLNILWCEDLMRDVFVPQAMMLHQADLWYRSSFDRSRLVETSPSSSLSSQHSSLAVEPAARHRPSSLRYPLMSVCLPYGYYFIATFFKLHIVTISQYHKLKHGVNIWNIWNIMFNVCFSNPLPLS